MFVYFQFIFYFCFLSYFFDLILPNKAWHNITTCTLCKWVFFPTRVHWGFIYEKLRKFTVSKRSLVVKPRIGTIYIIRTFNWYLSIHFQLVVIHQLGSTPWHGISFATRHCWQTTLKIVECYVASVRTSCCMLLRVIGSCRAKFETGQTLSHVQVRTMLRVVGSVCTNYQDKLG